ncbi:MAG: MFS transporter [Pseudomonadota bacterium]
MSDTSLTRTQWCTIATAVLLMAGIQMDFSGIAVVLPPMGVALDASSSSLEWILNAQLLAFAPPVIAIGRMADLFGQRRIAVLGGLLFAASTLAIGFLSDPASIIAFRALQGIGSAMVCVTSLSLVSSALDEPRRALGIGIFTGGFLIFAAAGPMIAGFLADALSWRWLFFVNGGFALAGVVLLYCFIAPAAGTRSGERFDFLGFLVLTASLGVLVLGLQLVGDTGWGSTTVVSCLVASLVLLAAFYKIEKHAASPLVDLSLFGDRNFAGACLFVFLSNLPVAALAFLLTLYIQYVIGYSAWVNGMLFLAMMVPVALFALLSGRLLQHISPPVALSLSMALMALSFVCLGLVHPDFGMGFLILGLVLFGSGRGLMFGIASPVAMGAVPESKAAAASGILFFSINIALPIGVSLLTALFRDWENLHLSHILALAGDRVSDDMRAEIVGLLSGSDAARNELARLAPEIAERVHQVVDHAFAHGFRNVMFVCLALSVAGMMSALIVRGGRLHDPK